MHCPWHYAWKHRLTAGYYNMLIHKQQSFRDKKRSRKTWVEKPPTCYIENTQTVLLRLSGKNRFFWGMQFIADFWCYSVHAAALANSVGEPFPYLVMLCHLKFRITTYCVLFCLRHHYNYSSQTLLC